jgi:riboflavin synthase
MFTGIVAAVSRTVSVETRSSGAVFSLERPAGWDDVRQGESICVSGVCLTVLPGIPGEENIVFDVSPETLRRSTLGSLRPGSRVNLERALAASDRFGGHVVAGHVDATTQVAAVVRSGDFWTFTFALSPDWARYVVEKGSIALDGVSLTVASLSASSFDVAVVPHTYSATTLGERKAGELVNVEVDVLGKYVERILKDRLDVDTVARDERLRALLEER